MSINSTIHSAWRAARDECAGSTLGEKLELGLKSAAAAGIAGLMALGPGDAQAKFYERLNGHVYEINENAAQGLTPDHWEVYYFKSGSPPSPDVFAEGHWGSDTDKDLNKLMTRVQKSIEDDAKYRRAWFCVGACRTSPYVYDNYFGPIAIMPSEKASGYESDKSLYESSDLLERYQRIQEKGEQLKDLLNQFLKVTGVLSTEKQLENLNEKVRSLDPSAVQGYLDNLHRGMEAVNMLRAALEGATQTAGNTALLLSQATQDLDAAEKYGQTISRALSAGPTVNTYSWNYSLTDYHFEDDSLYYNEVANWKVELGAQLKAQRESQTVINDQGRATNISPEISSYAASTLELTPGEMMSPSDKYPCWQVVMQCDSNSTCVNEHIQTYNLTDKKMILRFSSQNQANDFITKFNAQKAALLNPQRQQVAPAPNAIAQPLSPEIRRLIHEYDYERCRDRSPTYRLLTGCPSN
jgi:hypothetical protein